MKYSSLILAIQALLVMVASAQKPRANVEFCDCRFKMDSIYIAAAPARIQAQSTFQHTVDSSFKMDCGYLVVPENRAKKSSKKIRLPFIVLRSKNPAKKKDPVLFTAGGPGGSSLGWITNASRSTIVADRDCIAFEQRGTRFAIPYLRNFELDSAIRDSYRKNLNKDSMWLEGVKRYKKGLEKRGIDLAGYNTDETVSDIADLLTLLNIDSVNLFGVSYSGGLMLAVLQKMPARIRSLVLDSPLPTFIPIDQEEPANFMTALKILSQHCEKDSTDKKLYGDTWKRFDNYFRSINRKTFYHQYSDGNGKTLSIQYTKNELLDVIVNTMHNHRALKDVPYIINEMIRGNHGPYIQRKLEDILNRYIAPDGMRMSVYCADQAAYNSMEIIQQLYGIYPYLEGFRINDVYKAVCDCWKVPPVKATTKQPFYSDKPVLIGDGEMDAACSPLYMSMIKQYMPNSQCFLFINRSHGVGGKEFSEMSQQFLDDPYKKVLSPNKDIIAY
jgi:pimeloyl-ACP methyl ester carboxylesterase